LTFDNLTFQQSKGEELLPKNAEKYLLTLDELNSMYIQQVLNLTKGKVRGVDGAADRLGINPSTLRSRMKKMGIKYGLKSLVSG
jgi:DNA-binding NtrC family response regulator